MKDETPLNPAGLLRAILVLSVGLALVFDLLYLIWPTSSLRSVAVAASALPFGLAFGTKDRLRGTHWLLLSLTVFILQNGLVLVIGHLRTR